MSLRAKIEAVIYAAEEPVTLAQLAFLFGGEVLASSQEEGVQPAAESMKTEQPPLEPALDAENAVTPESTDLSSQDPEAAATTEAISQEPIPGPGDEKKAARVRERLVRENLKSVIAELIAEYASGDRGVEIREIAGGYRVATKPEYHDSVRSFVKSLKPPMKLSPQALETLAVIAYKQPVTAPEVNEIRGVDSGGVLGGLISRKLITTAGRKQVIGRPILYKTTKEFLLQFGLRDLNELPSIEEFEKMAGHMDAEDEERDAETTAALPFGRTDGDGEVAATNEAGETGQFAENAVEANAGEAGVAVSAPADSESEDQTGTTDSTPASEIIELDSHIAEESFPPADHEPELIMAVHPSTTIGSE